MATHGLTRAMSRCSLSSATTAPTRPTLAASRTTSLAQPAGRRYKATRARGKRALNVAPHPSFLAEFDTNRIVFNPPASAASVYHTPFKFLPKTDPRRRANLNELFSSSTTLSYAAAPAAGAAAPAGGGPALPPMLERNGVADDGTGKRHLRQSDVDEIVRLRGEDPAQWSVLKLARRFDCSPFFILQAVRASSEYHNSMKQRLAEVKKRWGPIRTKAREDRRKRKEMILTGDL